METDGLTGSKKPGFCQRCFRQNLLLLSTIVGVAMGFVVGFSVRPTNSSEDALMWLGLPGQLYLRLLKMMIVPLVVCSIITGTASVDPKANGRISLTAFIYIFLTNFQGAVLGILMYLLFKPGETRLLRPTEENPVVAIRTQDIFADLIRNIFPDNLFEATFRQTQTHYQIRNKTVNGSELISTKVVKTLTKTDGANVLGLIFACSLIGMAASSLGQKGKPFIKFFASTTDIILVVMRWFMWITPFGVLSLIAVAVAGTEDIVGVFKELGMFIAAVTVGVAIHQVVTMPIILYVTTRRNPFKFLLDISRPWLISFAVSSTAVAIPEMFHACEQKLRIDKRICRFVIPFSVTISANGSAVFIACSCLFISNLTDNTPGVSEILTIGLLATVTSLAIPSVPSASIVTIVMILSSMNIPLEAVALLLAVDWYLDRIRTTSSVVSHCHCAAVTYHFCRKYLRTTLSREEDIPMVSITADKSNDANIVHFKTVTKAETGEITIDIEKLN